MAFVKLHATILDSSIWSEPDHVRLVWITLLTMADADGIVQASVSGLARRAVVSREKTEDALRVFLSPDPDSRDGTTGERIEKVPGGWMVLNHANYRDKQTKQQEQTAARVRRWRAKQRKERSDTQSNDASVTSNAVTPRDAIPPPEAEADLDPDLHASACSTRASEPAAIDGPLLSPQAAMAVPIQDRAKRVLAHEHSADYAAPNEWPEVVAIAEAVHKSARWSPPKLGSYSRDSGVRAVVELLATGFTPPEVTRAMPRLVKSDWWQERRRTLASLTPNVVRRAVDDSGPVRSEELHPSVQQAIARGRRRLAAMAAAKEAKQCDE